MSKFKTVGCCCLIILFVAYSGIINPSFTSESIQIKTGISDYRVYQRNEANQADITFTGSCQLKNDGKVQVRLVDSQTFLNIIEWQDGGSYSKQQWQGELRNVPVGGPYRIEIRLLNASAKSVASISAENILVGDLWILAGQSNMQGAGELHDVESPGIWVNCYGYNETWAIASEPLHWLLDSIDPVHHLGLTGEELERARAKHKRNALAGAGCGLPFAKEMVQKTGVPIGLVPCAHGGTSMEQWDPAKKEQGGNSLYGSMYRRFLAVGGKVKGVLWYQGESDANEKAAPLFHERFTKFVTAVRHDFNDPDLPFYFVQIGRFTIDREMPQWDIIQEQQRLCAGEIPRCWMVSSIDLELDDLIHVGTQGHKRLGHRLAVLALKDLFGRSELEYGPQLESVLPLSARFKKYRLRFSSVNAALRAVGRPGGFSIRDQEGNDLALIYKIVLPEDEASIDLFLFKQPPVGACLWYGYGLDPYCNITDTEDMALPAFGPIPLDEAIYTFFLKMIREDPQNSSLTLMLPHILPVARNSPECKAESLPILKAAMKTMSSNTRLSFYPLLFALGDFSAWQAWINDTHKLSLKERKEAAKYFETIKDSPELKSNFVNFWQIVGTFDNTDCQGIDRVYEPEKDADLNRTYVNARGDTLKWKSASADTNGILDFVKNFGEYENVVAYAQTTIQAKKSVEVPILFGSDDAPVIWVNGEEVHREHIHRSAKPASDLLFVRLKRGTNTILVKVCQYKKGWGLCMQFLDKDGILSYQ